MKLMQLIEICQNETAVCQICRKEYPQEKFIKVFSVSGFLQVNNACYNCRKNHVLKRIEKQKKKEKQ